MRHARYALVSNSTRRSRARQGGASLLVVYVAVGGILRGVRARVARRYRSFAAKTHAASASSSFSHAPLVTSGMCACTHAPYVAICEGREATGRVRRVGEGRGREVTRGAARTRTPGRAAPDAGHHPRGHRRGLVCRRDDPRGRGHDHAGMDARHCVDTRVPSRPGLELRAACSLVARGELGFFLLIIWHAVEFWTARASKHRCAAAHRLYFTPRA